MTKKQSDKDKCLREGNFCIGTGIGIGALGLGATLAVGATCPICVVAAPALIGVGVVQRLKASKSDDCDDGSGDHE
ncbi:MAG: hypothetical protein KDD62_00630 [Bdellovibrionales bacterium]|nr:hypothetical protein [Bdellovibrionales bacterium]